MENELASNGTQQCSRLKSCTFFKNYQDNTYNLMNRLKQNYCLGKNSHCARFYITEVLGSEYLPDSMMPQQWEWANTILLESGRSSAVQKPKEMELPLQS